MTATIALVDDLSRGQDLGVLVVVSGAIAMLLHTCTQADVVARIRSALDTEARILLEEEEG